MKSLMDIAQILKSKNCFYILTHRYPDGDTLGSAYALCRALQKMGKQAKVMCEDSIPKRYLFMTKYVNDQDFECESVITVDIADARKLLGNTLSKYADKVNICIDHHMTNKNYAEITFVDATAAATAEIIYFIIEELGIEIDQEMAQCIYVGISTDTGCFKYSNVTAQTHRITAELMEKNIDIIPINKMLFDTKSKNMINLYCMIYSGVEYFFNGKCAIICVTCDMIKKSGIPDEELEGIASIPRGIEGVDVGITLREKPDNICKVSVRTNENTSAVGICKEFGGGGHSCTGGFTVEGTVEQAKAKVLSVIRSKLNW